MTARRKPRVPERDLQVLLTDWLTLAGILHTVTDAALVVAGGEARMSSVRKSWPDVSAVMPATGARLMAIEVKAQDGRLSRGQEQMLGELRTAGAFVVVPRSLTDLVDAIEEEYRELGIWKRDELERVRRATKAHRAGTGAR